MATKKIISYLTDGDIEIEDSQERVQEIGFDWIFVLYIIFALGIFACVPIAVVLGVREAYQY